jgi:hypothetical protein
MSKKKKAQLSLQEILTSLDVKNPKKVKIEPKLKEVIHNYYQQTELFFDRAPADLQNQIDPLQKAITEINKKLTLSYHIEKEKIIAGVVCYVTDQKAINRIYDDLRREKSVLQKKIQKIKKQYQDYEDMIVEELQEIRRVKRKLEKQGAEYIAVLPTRVLVELTKECGLYTFKNIKKGGKFRINHVGFAEADEEINLYSTYPKIIIKVNTKKKEVFLEKRGDIFPYGFGSHVMNLDIGFVAMILAGVFAFILNICVGGQVIFPFGGFIGFIFNWYVTALISLVALFLVWMTFCMVPMLWRYYVGYPAKLHLPPAPKRVQDRLQKFKKLGLKVYPIVEEKGFYVSFSKRTEEIKRLLDEEPILVADDGKCSIVIDQYGDFLQLEIKMIDKIKKMYCPESIIGSYNLN